MLYLEILILGALKNLSHRSRLISVPWRELQSKMTSGLLLTNGSYWKSMWDTLTAIKGRRTKTNHHKPPCNACNKKPALSLTAFIFLFNAYLLYIGVIKITVIQHTKTPFIHWILLATWLQTIKWRTQLSTTWQARLRLFHLCFCSCHLPSLTFSCWMFFWNVTT